jgi:hypothetical protein
LDEEIVLCGTFRSCKPIFLVIERLSEIFIEYRMLRYIYMAFPGCKILKSKQAKYTESNAVGTYISTQCRRQAY